MNNQSEDVNQLILSCSYSKESLEKLYIKFKRSVFAIGFTITSDYHLAEDCVAETFIRLTQIKKLDISKGDGVGFIVTVARNVAFELRRQHRHDAESTIPEYYGVADHTAENSIFIKELFLNLSDSQRQIVTLRCYCELQFKQIAKIMKMPETTVKSRYNKAIAILKEKAGVNSER